MKTIREMIDNLLAAMTFAEMGEHETALSFLQDSKRRRADGRAAQTDETTPEIVREARLRERLSDHFAAAAFAEAGDFDTAKEMLPSFRRQNTVLLAIEGDVPTEPTFDYAVNLCKRIRAGMDILQALSDDSEENDRPSPALMSLLPQLEREGIPYTVSVCRKPARTYLYDYVKQHKNVVTAVIDAPDLDRGKNGASLKEIFKRESRRLAIPFVTVSSREGSRSS